VAQRLQLSTVDAVEPPTKLWWCAGNCVRGSGVNSGSHLEAFRRRKPSLREAPGSRGPRTHFRGHKETIDRLSGWPAVRVSPLSLHCADARVETVAMVSQCPLLNASIE
jgi:hypothetical protein